MYSRPDKDTALLNTARIALILAVAAFGAVVVRNVTDVMRGIAGVGPQIAAIDPPHR